MNTSAFSFENALATFTGTTTWFPHWSNRYTTFTEGVYYFCDKAKCWWLLDIFVQEIMPASEGSTFINIIANVNAYGVLVLTADDGNGRVFFRTDFGATTLPEGEWQFYICNDVILLPSEY